MPHWGIAKTAPEKEKIKAELADELQGLNAVGDISYVTYCSLFDFCMPLLDRMYELGQKEAKNEGQKDKKV